VEQGLSGQAISDAIRKQRTQLIEQVMRQAKQTYNQQ
jgi:hypothetical protein